MEAKISPTITEHSTGRAPAHSKHLSVLPNCLCGASGLATDFFPLKIPEFCLLLLRLLLAAQRVVTAGQGWSGMGEAPKSPRPFSAQFRMLAN